MRGRGASWFLAGATMGAAASLLLAPHSGRRTRRLLRQKADYSRDYLSDLSDEIAQKGHEVYELGKTLVDDAARLVDNGMKSVNR